MIITPGIYEHYKGNRYRVIDTVTHSETEETLVLYQPLYGEQKLWVRPYDMFTESVNLEGQRVCRFRLIKE
ncbi:DUF1653 domain-containing protein [Idiomarina sp. X4]|uniref:DUF1653 domain-containing protein n=1 Tax=unclassified Idiomarina TaxID=2614829 RepID=UPI000C294DD5|nr:MULTISPECIES: DUF1653 domain-containing protein [unclassified Idiomarina]ATZ74067.1 DUF1653 domain-containing protein [Idiomarina sp. X4]RXS41939.1 DUF1653 domain-containing protein [Idiomarina sp. 29L]